MENKMKRGKGLMLVGALLFVLALGGWWWGRISDRQVLERYEKGDKMMTGEDYLRLQKVVEKMNETDRFGSTTPEGTLDLFVTALKKKDIDLAAKYFVPEKQGKMLEDLKEGVKSGGVTALISDLEKERVGAYYQEKDRYESTIFVNDVAEFSYLLKLNHQTGIWKIENI